MLGYPMALSCSPSVLNTSLNQLRSPRWGSSIPGGGQALVAGEDLEPKELRGE